MRVVKLLVCVLTCHVALTAASKQRIRPQSVQLDTPTAAAQAPVNATAAEAKPMSVGQPEPTMAAKAAASAQNDTWEVESMVSGDISEDGSSTAADVEALGRAAAVAAAGGAEVTRTGSTKAKDGQKSKETSSSSKGKKSDTGKKHSDKDHASDGDEADDESDSNSGHGSGDHKGKGKKSSYLSECPVWSPDSINQGLTSGERPGDMSIFHELSVDEYNAVLNFLYSRKKLHLEDIVTSDPNRTLTVANYVHAIYLEVPPKQEVLEFLDKYGPKPARKARAVLVLGEAEPPVVREVVVTLRDEEDTIIVSDMERVNIHSSKHKSLPFNMRPQGPLDENGVIAALAATQDTLNKVFKHAFHGFTYGEDCNSKCIDFSLVYTQVFPQENIPRGAYVQFYWYTEQDGDGNYLHPLPVQALVGADGESLEDWSILRIWFAGRFFDSAADLLHAWHHDVKGLKSTFEFKLPEGDAALFATFKRRPGPVRGAKQPVGPISWEPYGRRFSISQGNKVEWLGFSLYVGYTPNYGARFWDLRFKHERVAYELSLQEAMAMYGASDLSQTNTVFLDSSFGMGYNLRELAQGIDCPMTAAFMDADIFFGGMSGPTTFKNAICVFEHSPNLPVLRHYSSAYKYYGAVAGGQLIIRMISTVYNYDYIQDLVLGVDGTIDVKVTTSGYIQATAFRAFYPQHFGFPVSANVSGTVHTHVLAWKADLDIAGTHNSLNMLEFKSASAENGLGGEIFMNKFDANIIETEDDSGFINKIYEPKMPVVINEHHKNKWGSPRGYKVQLNRPLANLEPKKYSRSAGLGFWKWNFVATKREEHESHSSSFYTQSDLASPPTCLPDYVNGDSIRKKDLVVWVNSGLYHVPMAEDAPVTPASGHNQLGFSLIPYNWADENPATDMADMFTVDGETVNSTVPAVKKAAHKCQPTYSSVKFGTTGFEGVTSTDEDVSTLAIATASKKGGKRKGKQDGQDGVTTVVPGASSTVLPASSVPAQAAPKPDKAPARVCRRSKRWGSC